MDGEDYRLDHWLVERVAIPAFASSCPCCKAKTQQKPGSEPEQKTLNNNTPLY
jgi:hypothetical protein